MHLRTRAEFQPKYQMDVNWDALNDVLVILITGGVGGAITGAGVANYFTNRRHRKQRKTVLFAFLKVWEAEVDANRPATSPWNAPERVPDQFDRRRLTLIEKAAPVEFDFSDDKRTKFKGFVDAITSMTPGQVGDDKGRENLGKAVRDLTSFLESN
jgi:hypothetical protein